MKRKITLITSIAIVAIATVFTFNLASDSQKSDLMSKNVEALAAAPQPIGPEGSKDYNDAVNSYCRNPSGRTGCVTSAGNTCSLGIFCIR